MAEDAAGVAATDAVVGQDPTEVSSQKQPEQEKSPNLSEENKTPEEKNDGDGKAETKDPEKLDRFDKHPGFQRMVRKNAKLSAEMGALKDQNAEFASLMKEMIALNKGEEYKPEPKAETAIPDAQDLLDNEMETLLQAEALSPQEEAEVVKIAQKYAQDLGEGKKIYLPAITAHEIWKDQQNDAVPAVSTKPSSGVSEAKVAAPNTDRKPAKNVYEAVTRAKQMLARENSTNL